MSAYLEGLEGGGSAKEKRKKEREEERAEIAKGIEFANYARNVYETLDFKRRTLEGPPGQMRFGGELRGATDEELERTGAVRPEPLERKRRKILPWEAEYTTVPDVTKPAPQVRGWTQPIARTLEQILEELKKKEMVTLSPSGI